MDRNLAIIEHCLLTISQQHNAIKCFIQEKQSDAISDALVNLMEVIEEIEHEHELIDKP
jgi:hypothetical protein